MRPLVLDSSSQFNESNYPAYSESKDSPFWQEIDEVYKVVNSIKDDSEEMEILTFWDDNPFVSRHKGHLMFQDKKMTPGGHWLSIARIISRHEKADLFLASKAYAVTAIALYDAFISCWSLKYEAVRVRPETVINSFDQ